MEKILSLAKNRGFVFQGSEIYGGLANTWDYGPLGIELKNNIKRAWWKKFIQESPYNVGLDAAIFMNPRTWEASGHVGNFSDPMMDCKSCKSRLRADKLIEEYYFKEKNEDVVVDGLPFKELENIIERENIKCPECGKHDFTNIRQFNLMFKTNQGVVENSTSEIYLRPETAQGIFVNFKNVQRSMRKKLPFGIGQIGKSFRNEITPGNFIFRTREFEQMEIEYFVDPKTWEAEFEKWINLIYEWCDLLGLDRNKIFAKEVPKEDRAHYSKRTVDFEYQYPIGKEEMLGLAYRTDFDLSNIEREASKSMAYTIKGTNESFVPHVIEPSFGVERALMAVISEAYREDEVNGEKRVYLKFPEHLAPIRFAVSPLLKNKPELVDKAKEVFSLLKKKYSNVMWDDNGNIGKRYRRQDEIGTPYCVVIDFDTLSDGTVTVRDRDTTEQKRVMPEEI